MQKGSLVLTIGKECTVRVLRIIKKWTFVYKEYDCRVLRKVALFGIFMLKRINFNFI